MKKMVKIELYKENGERDYIRCMFAGDIRQLTRSERVSIRTKDKILCFLPEGGDQAWGAFKPDEAGRITIRNSEDVKLVKQFCGEYDRLHKHENGFIYVDLSERMNAPQEPQETPQEPQERPKTESTYKNPYKEPKKETTALLAIVREHRDKAEKIMKDIEEAEKLLRELNEQLRNEEETAKTAEALMALLERRD